jgi:predicted nucleotidyltransferase component of viral defense system
LLLFTRNLDRHSTDLDFDSDKRLNLEGRIQEEIKAAAEGRTEARNLYDRAHLVRYYGDELSTAQLDRTDALTEDLDDLAARLGPSFETDDVLRGLATVEDTVIALREAVEEELEYRQEIEPELDLEEDGWEI